MRGGIGAALFYLPKRFYGIIMCILQCIVTYTVDGNQPLCCLKKGGAVLCEEMQASVLEQECEPCAASSHACTGRAGARVLRVDKLTK